MANVTKRGNSYLISVSMGYDIYGKQIRKYKTWTPPKEKTEKQIEKELEKQIVLFEEQCKNGAIANTNTTLADFIDYWFEEYGNKKLKEKTRHDYHDTTERIIKPAMGHLKLNKITPTQVISFYNNLAKTGFRNDYKYKPRKILKELVKKSGYTQSELAHNIGIGLRTLESVLSGNNVSWLSAEKITKYFNRHDIFTKIAVKNDKLSGGTLLKYHNVLSSILTSAVQWQLIASNPCDKVPKPKRDTKEKIILNETELFTMIELLDKEPILYRTAVMLILFTGMRSGEAMGLEWTDIDFENKIIRVNKNLQYTVEKGIYKDTPKTNKSIRTIAISDDLISMLKEYQKHCLELQLMHGDQWRGGNDVFIRDNGEIINPRTFGQWLNKFTKRNNLPHITPHSLRHLHASLLIANGVDIPTVSKTLGHSDINTTLRIYTHAIEERNRQIPDTMQNILNKNRKTGNF